MGGKMKKPEKKDIFALYPDCEYPKGFNYGYKVMEKYYQWLIKKDYVRKEELSEKEIAEILRNTVIGTYQPIGEKDKPKPKPKQLFMSDYNVDLDAVYKLAKVLYLTQGR